LAHGNYPRLQTLLHLSTTYGTTPEVLDTALTLLDPTHPPETAAAAALYRSQAEWFLAQYLEAKPTTMGRFQVNAQLDLDFGGHPMEVDFLDPAAKIVIELDGHYHFQSLDNYRRDRRKDRILQQQGFLVLRFLSEDVVSDLETILDAVDQALATRHPHPSEP
jgi:very-short-patch-repair endonuclease